MGLSILVGSVAGLILGIYLFGAAIRGGIVFVAFFTVGGFLVGAACGSLLDFLWTKLRGPADSSKKARRKKRRP
jgi:hypothetical protein